VAKGSSLTGAVKAGSGLLPSKERIRKNREIQAILKRKQLTFNSPLLRIVAEFNQLKTPRLVVVCPKSLGSAVVRNRIRRTIVGYYANNRHKVGKNLDMVLFPRGVCAGEAQGGEIEKALRKWDCLAE
jgi:ribonuclease P protein component